MPIGDRPAKPLHRSRVGNMLRNPYYIGVVCFRGVEYEGTHKPLIGKQLFYEVQTQLDAKRLAEERHRVNQHYLKGSLWCGHCGERLLFTSVLGHGGRYDYFVCAGRHAKRSDCQLDYLSVDTVEQVVMDHYARVHST